MQVDMASTTKAADDVADSDDSMSTSDAPNVDELRKALEAAPMYESHLNLVNALRADGDDMQALRSARSAFSAAYPLPASLWMQWAEDELAMDDGAESRSFVANNVLRCGVRDYLSIPLWRRFLKLQMERVRSGQCKEGEWQTTLDELRSSGALEHFLHGAELRNMIDEAKDGSVPLKEGEGDIMRSEEVQDMVVSCGVFEEKLVDAGSSPEKEDGLRDETLKLRFASYASFLAELCPRAARSVWERCVAECFLDASVWLQYAAFCREKMTSGDERAVLVRAARNVPGELGVWRETIFNVERRSEADILTPSSAADELLCVLQMAHVHIFASSDWDGAMRLSLAAILCYRRLQLPDKVRDAVSATLAYNEEGSVYWANCKMALAALCVAEGRPQKAVEHVHDVLGRRTELEWWIRGWQMLGAAGADDEVLRALFRRGIVALTRREDVQSLGALWAQYECTTTSCCSFDEVSTAMDKRLATLPQSDAKPKMRPRKGRATVSNVAEEVGSKRKKPDVKRRRKAEPKETSNVAPEKEANGSAKKEDEAEGTSKKESECEPNTIFIKNLHFKATEESIREKFEGCGEIVGIRVPRRGDGAGKGIAYVEFGDDKATEAALKHHESAILGRTVWVYRSKPPRRSTKGGGGRGRGGGIGSTRGRGRRRLAIDAVQAAASEAGDAEMEDAAPAEVAKTQEDFRSMVLGKK